MIERFKGGVLVEEDVALQEVWKRLCELVFHVRRCRNSNCTSEKINGGEDMSSALGILRSGLEECYAQI